MYKDIYRKMYYTGTRYIYIFEYKCVVYDSVCLIYVDNEYDTSASMKKMWKW